MDLTINGASHTVDLPDDMPLLWALRDGLNIISVKYGITATATATSRGRI